MRKNVTFSKGRSIGRHWILVLLGMGLFVLPAANCDDGNEVEEGIEEMRDEVDDATDEIRDEIDDRM